MYNKIQYRVGRIIEPMKAEGKDKAKPRNEKNLVIFSVPIEAVGRKLQRDAVTVQCLQGKGWKDIPDVCKEKHFYYFLVNILKKEELELKLKLFMALIIR